MNEAFIRRAPGRSAILLLIRPERDDEVRWWARRLLLIPGPHRPVCLARRLEDGRVRAQARAEERGRLLLQRQEEARVEAVLDVLDRRAAEVREVVLAQLLQGLRAAVVAVFRDPRREVGIEKVPDSPFAV